MTTRTPFDQVFGNIASGHAKQIAHKVGVTLTTFYAWRKSGIPSCALKKIPVGIAEIKIEPYVDARAERMAYLFQHGSTLAEIGTEYGISRERVRQIISKHGITWEDGGQHVKALVNAIYKTPKDKFMDVYGCFKSEAYSLNGGSALTTRGTNARKYVRQRTNAKARGIDWELTFPEWIGIWKESGKFELRGRGKGYCMARVGDTGGYSVDNVEIITIGQNFSDSYYKTTWQERFPIGHPIFIKKTHCIRGHQRTPENLTIHGACKICQKERDRIYYKNTKQVKANSEIRA